MGHTVFQITLKQQPGGKKPFEVEVTHPYSFTLNPSSITHMHKHISMETVKRIGGVQKD